MSNMLQFGPPPTGGTLPPPVADVVSLIISAVERRNGPALGTDLASLVRAQYPGVRWAMYGPPNFRAFVASNVPELVEVGRQGGDLLYALRKNAPHPGLDTPTNKPAPTTESSGVGVWRAFSSPNSGQVIASQVNIETGAWRLVEPGMADNPEWRTVTPLSTEEHLTIGRDFLETLGGSPVEGELRSAIAMGPRWWVEYRNVMRRHPDIEAAYRAWRVERIAALLRKRLDGMGLPDQAIESAIRKVAPNFARVQPRAPEETTAAKLDSPAALNKGDLRALAQALVLVIPEEELRAFRIRLGDVFDALRR